ncbi:hypothetical protein EJB05_49688, partial [Eragrostis curvula]
MSPLPSLAPSPTQELRKLVIGEVSNITRSVQPSMYTPQHVSIGPNHRTWHPTLARDDEKNACLRAILPVETTVEACLDELTLLEDQARSCYSRKVDNMDSDQFVRTLLRDGCYLLACFKEDDADDDGRSSDGSASSPADHRGGTPSVVPATGGRNTLDDVAVVRDVFFLAENQIPFFVVDKIHQLSVVDGGAPTVNPVVWYPKKLLECRQYSVAEPEIGGESWPGDLLHLLYMHLMPAVLKGKAKAPSGRGVPDKKTVGRWRKATEYDSAGIKFRSLPLGTDGVSCILDVKMDSRRGILGVPRLNIDADTWRLLRNLMALEQHNPEATGKHVTAYCIFMSQVASTAADVDLLSGNGVIVHVLGSHTDAAVFFTSLCKGIMFNANEPGSNYLLATYHQMEKQFRSRLRRWKALLVRKHSNPWITVGLIAGALGLACVPWCKQFSLFWVTGMERAN